MEKLDSYFETTDDSLWSYIENTIWKMGKENIEYNSLTKKIESLLDDHPNLRHVLEDEIVTEISIDDVKALIELKSLYFSQRDIELENLFYLGGSNLYYYLKRMNLIEDKK